MKQLNSKLRKVKNPYNLCFLSMQVIYCLDKLSLPEEISQLETIIDIVTDIVDNLSEDYNHVTRILVSLYYL